MIEYRMQPLGTAGGQTTSGQLPTSTSIKKKKKNVYILGEREREIERAAAHAFTLGLTHAYGGDN